MSKQQVPLEDLVEVDLPGYMEAIFLDPEECEEETFDASGKKVE